MPNLQRLTITVSERAEDAERDAKHLATLDQDARALWGFRDTIDAAQKRMHRQSAIAASIPGVSVRDQEHIANAADFLGQAYVNIVSAITELDDSHQGDGG